MVEYRGRKLDIDDDFQRMYKDAMAVELNQVEMDCYIQNNLKIRPDSVEFSKLPDSKVLAVIIDGASKDIQIMSGE